MQDKFAASEIVELGVQIEINGRDFYATLRDKMKNREIKKAFSFLAEEEEKHIAKFRQILDSVHKYKPKEAYPEEYFSYMNSLASTHVFTEKNKGKEIANSIEDKKEAIDLGIKFEKESVIFYEGIKKAVPEKDQKIVDELIREEEDHIRKLVELRKKLQLNKRI